MPKKLEEFTHLSLLSPTQPNIYIIEGHMLKPNDLHITPNIENFMAELIISHGRFLSGRRFFHFQSIIHVSDFAQFMDPFSKTDEYYGVFFFSNIPNGTEVYFKPRVEQSFQGPFPWFRGNITMPIEKLMEVGEEMVSYPKIGKGIKEFLEKFQYEFHSAKSTGETRSGSSRYFDARLRMEYIRGQEYRYTSKFNPGHFAMVREDPSTPYGC